VTLNIKHVKKALYNITERSGIVLELVRNRRNSHWNAADRQRRWRRDRRR